MKEYEVIIDTINPCAGAKRADMEICEMTLEDPVAWVKANARFPILSQSRTEAGDLYLSTGDGMGFFVNYTFTE